MNKTDQKRIVTDLTISVGLEVTRQIDAGKIPEGWDGHELRVLLADKFADAAEMSTINRNKRSVRAREYRNTVLVSNL